MHWLAAHVYVSLLTLAGLLLLTGVYVAGRTAVPESDGAVTWSGAGGFAFLGGGNGGASDERIRTEDLLRNQNRSAEYSILPIFNPDEPQSTLLNDVSLESLLEQLSPPSGTTGSQEGEAGGMDIYDFIPRGLISTEVTAANKTPLQKELFEYGNRVGIYIRAFDDTHTDMIQILKNAYEDRSNAEKQTAAIQIGKEYQTLGQELEQMDGIPASVASMHLALARAYKEAGKKMVIKIQTKTDAEFLAAMNAYNASVLEHIRASVALASYFSAAGVQFSTTDAGSIFTFSAVSF